MASLLAFALRRDGVAAERERERRRGGVGTSSFSPPPPLHVSHGGHENKKEEEEEDRPPSSPPPPGVAASGSSEDCDEVFWTEYEKVSVRGADLDDDAPSTPYRDAQEDLSSDEDDGQVFLTPCSSGDAAVAAFTTRVQFISSDNTSKEVAASQRSFDDDDASDDVNATTEISSFRTASSTSYLSTLASPLLRRSRSCDDDHSSSLSSNRRREPNETISSLPFLPPVVRSTRSFSPSSTTTNTPSRRASTAIDAGKTPEGLQPRNLGALRSRLLLLRASAAAAPSVVSSSTSSPHVSALATSAAAAAQDPPPPSSPSVRRVVVDHVEEDDGEERAAPDTPDLRDADRALTAVGKLVASQPPNRRSLSSLSSPSRWKSTSQRRQSHRRTANGGEGRSEELRRSVDGGGRMTTNRTGMKEVVVVTNGSGGGGGGGSDETTVSTLTAVGAAVASAERKRGRTSDGRGYVRDGRVSYGPTLVPAAAAVAANHHDGEKGEELLRVLPSRAWLDDKEEERDEFGDDGGYGVGRNGTHDNRRSRRGRPSRDRPRRRRESDDFARSYRPLNDSQDEALLPRIGGDGSGGEGRARSSMLAAGPNDDSFSSSTSSSSSGGENATTKGGGASTARTPSSMSYAWGHYQRYREEKLGRQGAPEEDEYDSYFDDDDDEDDCGVDDTAFDRRWDTLLHRPALDLHGSPNPNDVSFSSRRGLFDEGPARVEEDDEDIHGSPKRVSPYDFSPLEHFQASSPLREDFLPQGNGREGGYRPPPSRGWGPSEIVVTNDAELSPNVSAISHGTATDRDDGDSMRFGFGPSSWDGRGTLCSHIKESEPHQVERAADQGEVNRYSSYALDDELLRRKNYNQRLSHERTLIGGASYALDDELLRRKNHNQRRSKERTLNGGASYALDEELLRRKNHNQRRSKERIMIGLVQRLQDNPTLVAEVEAMNDDVDSSYMSMSLVAEANTFVRTPLDQDGILTGYNAADRERLVGNLDKIVHQMELAQREEEFGLAMMDESKQELRRALCFVRMVVLTAFKAEETNVAHEHKSDYDDARAPTDVPASSSPPINSTSKLSQIIRVSPDDYACGRTKWKPRGWLRGAIGVTKRDENGEIIRGGDTALFSLPSETSTPNTSNVSMTSTITTRPSPLEKDSLGGRHLRRTVEVMATILQKITIANQKLLRFETSLTNEWILATEEIKRNYLQLMSINTKDACALTSAFVLSSSPVRNTTRSGFPVNVQTRTGGGELFATTENVDLSIDNIKESLDGLCASSPRLGTAHDFNQLQCGEESPKFTKNIMGLIENGLPERESDADNEDEGVDSTSRALLTSFESEAESGGGCQSSLLNNSEEEKSDISTSVRLVPQCNLDETSYGSDDFAEDEDIFEATINSRENDQTYPSVNQSNRQVDSFLSPTSEDMASFKEGDRCRWDASVVDEDLRRETGSMHSPEPSPQRDGPAPSPEKETGRTLKPKEMWALQYESVMHEMRERTE